MLIGCKLQYYDEAYERHFLASTSQEMIFIYEYTYLVHRESRLVEFDRFRRFRRL